MGYVIPKTGLKTSKAKRPIKVKTAIKAKKCCPFGKKCFNCNGNIVNLVLISFRQGVFSRIR